MENFVVNADASGMRLDRFLRSQMEGLQQSLIQKWARKGLLRINGKRSKADYRLQTNDQVSCPSLEVAALEYTAPKKNISQELIDEFRSWVIYEDDNILAINKPAGLAVQGGTSLKEHLDMLFETIESQEGYLLRLVHRLDKETSGVLVLAKNRAMAEKLTQLFKEREIQKTYLALVVGSPREKSGLIDLALSKASTSQGERVVTDSADAREAITQYEVLKESDGLSLLRLKPKTGRMHQIRAHCKYGLATPILGDAKYGGKGALPFGREDHIFLHSFMISFALENDQVIEITADLPPHFFRYVKHSEIIP